MNRRSLSDSLKAAAKASTATLVAMVLFARPAIRDAWASGPMLALSVLVAMALLVGLVVFSARWFGVFRTREEWEALKAAGAYRKEDESRRALVVFGFGLAVLIALGSLVYAYDCLLKSRCAL